MRAAERRQKIVQRDLVGQVFDRETQRPAAATFAMKQIIRPNSDVEKIARLHAIGIMIVILGASLRQRQQG